MPNTDCVYEILRSALNKLIEKGLVTTSCRETIGSPASGQSCLPPLDWVVDHLEYQPETVPMQLRQIAQTAVGLSARTLRALPFSALLGYTGHGVCDVGNLLPPIQLEIDRETGSQCERSLSSTFDVVEREVGPAAESSTDSHDAMLSASSSPFIGIDVEAR